jgi:DNA-binding XRE family transcriptional regulator
MERNASDTLGKVIKAGRVARKMSQERLAEIVGLSTRYIMAIENEHKKPALDKLVKIVRALGIKTDDIFYPENAVESTSVERLSRLLLECSEHEIKAVTALVETLLYEKP